jgi:hypothetical protein
MNGRGSALPFFAAAKKTNPQGQPPRLPRRAKPGSRPSQDPPHLRLFQRAGGAK